MGAEQGPEAPGAAEDADVRMLGDGRPFVMGGDRPEADPCLPPLPHPNKPQEAERTQTCACSATAGRL
jgi:hypothetical protein